MTKWQRYSITEVMNKGVFHANLRSCSQGSSRQVWCGQVRSAYVCTPPNKILVCFFGPDDRVASYSTGFGFPIVRNSLISQVTPFTDEACETTLVRLEERKLLEGRLGRVLSHCLQPSRKFQDVRCVVGGLAWASA